MFSLCQNRASRGIRFLPGSRKATDNEALLVIFKERLCNGNVLDNYLHRMNSTEREGEKPDNRL